MAIEIFGRPNYDALGTPVANYRGLGPVEMACAIDRLPEEAAAVLWLEREQWAGCPHHEESRDEETSDVEKRCTGPCRATASRPAPGVSCRARLQRRLGDVGVERLRGSYGSARAASGSGAPGGGADMRRQPEGHCLAR